jgi:hypothetical protein
MIDAAPWRGSLRESAREFRSRAAATPGRLRLLSILIAAGAGVLWLVGSTTLIGSQRMVDGVGRQSVPNIIGAQRLHEAFAATDRSAANAYLLGDTGSNDARTQYQESLGQATSDLEQTTERNSGGQQATQNLQAVNTRVAQYAGLVETARANNRQGFPVGVAYLRQASDLMHDPRSGILARVDRVADLNTSRLADQNASEWIIVVALGAFFVLALALVLTLVLTQAFLRRRFRRRHNLHLLAATLLLALLSGWVAFQDGTTYAQLRIAERQVYPQLHTLYQTRSLVDDLNANTSLTLIAPSNATTYDDAFRTAAAEIADRPLSDDVVADAGRSVVRFRGLLADAIAGASFPGERQAVLDAVGAYQAYLKIDAAVRARAPSDHQGAVTLALGTGDGQLGAAFAKLDAALGRAIAIDQAQFDDAIRMADPGWTLNLGIPLLTIAVAVLAFWGLQPRISEYRV